MGIIDTLKKFEQKIYNLSYPNEAKKLANIEKYNRQRSEAYEKEEAKRKLTPSEKYSLSKERNPKKYALLLSRFEARHEPTPLEKITYIQKMRKMSRSYRKKLEEIEGKKLKQRLISGMKAVRMIYPQLPSSRIPSMTQYQGKKGYGQRGRPRGSYKYPGGVYNWRKMQRAAKAQAKYQMLLRRTQAMQNYPRMVAQRAYNQEMQYQEVPQEMTGYEQQIIPQYPQQSYPQQQQQREIKSVFKSSGGSPYPPVNQRPLQNIPNYNQNTIEDIDMFSGKRIIKQLPAKEAWIS